MRPRPRASRFAPLLALCLALGAGCARHAATDGASAQAEPTPILYAVDETAAPDGQGAPAQPAAGSPAARANSPVPANATPAAKRPGAGKPAILSVSVKPAIVHNGDTVSWSVHTTPDVIAVEAHVRVATIDFQKAAPGRFTMAFTIPTSVPGFFHSLYSVEIVGHVADGSTVSRWVPLNFR